MKETLTCTQCEKRWRRERSRGRKPHLCPKCVKASTKTQSKKVVEVVEVTKVKKARKIAAKIIQASSNKDKENTELSVGKVFSYYHPSDDKLKEETKGGSKWKCKHCGYTLSVKFSVSAVPTHKCTENGRSYPMERIDS